jgi:hypothetical protein
MGNSDDPPVVNNPSSVPSKGLTLIEAGRLNRLLPRFPPCAIMLLPLIGCPSQSQPVRGILLHFPPVGM